MVSYGEEGGGECDRSVIEIGLYYICIQNECNICLYLNRIIT